MRGCKEVDKRVLYAWSDVYHLVLSGLPYFTMSNEGGNEKTWRILGYKLVLNCKVTNGATKVAQSFSIPRSQIQN